MAVRGVVLPFQVPAIGSKPTLADHAWWAAINEQLAGPEDDPWGAAPGDYQYVALQ